MNRPPSDGWYREDIAAGAFSPGPLLSVAARKRGVSLVIRLDKAIIPLSDGVSTGKSVKQRADILLSESFQT